jgi:hypothetical protein
MCWRDRGVAARRVERHANVKIAFLSHARHRKNAAVLLAKPTALIDDHLEGMLTV